MLAGAKILIDGQPLDPALEGRLIEVRVDDNLMLPDAVSLRIADPGLEHVDSSPLEIGAEVEVQLAGAEASALAKVFKGQIAAVEPEFGAGGAVLAARGYDYSHALNRTRRTRTFQNMTAADIARKVVTTAGLTPGTIDSGGGPHDFVQQNNETDWDFLWRLASRIDFELVVLDKTLHFRRAGGSSGSPLTLRWGENLVSFRPRVTGVQQVDEVIVRGWDPKTKKAIEATARADGLDSRIGIARDRVVGAIGGGTVTVADRPVVTDREADALAKSVAAQLANAYVEAKGTCHGDPRLRAGSKVELAGIGQRFGGSYMVSSSTHLYRGAKGYETRFTISGRTPRSLVDLMTPAPRHEWGGSVVIGVVTQNEDPDAMGRVRVKYPALGDDTEGWWARIASPAAGKDRGLLMMPVVGDEVLLAFEHGDVRRPYVLGSVWNAKEPPGELVKPDGSFELRSDQKVSVTSKGDVSITGDKDFKLEAGAKVAQKASGDLSVEGGQTVKVKAGTSLTIEGGSDVTIKAGGASVSLKPGGVVQVSGSQIMLG